MCRFMSRVVRVPEYRRSRQMGIPSPSPSSAAQGPPRARPIRSHMAIRLAIPATCLVVLCGLALGVALAGPVGSVPWLRSSTPQQQALVEAAALAGAATLVALLTVLLVAAYARRLSHEISDL